MRRISRIIGADIKPIYLFYIYMVAAALFILPIIIANVYYADDLLRSSAGVYNWTAVGRPIGEYMMNALSFSVSEPHPDLGQLTQVLTIPLLALAAFLFVYNQYTMISTKEALIGLFIIFNPFLLENLSYRFDALFMITAYLLSIVSATLPKRKSWLRMGLVSMILYVIAFLMYQPIIFVAIPVIIYQLYRATRVNEDSKPPLAMFIYRVLFLAAGTLAGVILIKLLIPDAERSSMIPLDHNFISEVKESMLSAVRLVVQYVSEAAWVYLPLIAFAILGYMFFMYRFIRSRKVKSIYFWLLLTILIASPFFTILLASGPMVFLQSQIVSWRVIPAFGVWVSIALFFINDLGGQFFHESKARILTATIAVLVGVQIMGMSFTYGSLLDRHDSFMRERTSMVANILNVNGWSVRPILMVGSYGTPRSAGATMSLHPSLLNVIPYGDNWVPRFMLQELGYGVRSDMKNNYPEIGAICKMDIKPSFTSKHFDIYDLGRNNPVVVFSKGSYTHLNC